MCLRIRSKAQTFLLHKAVGHNIYAMLDWIDCPAVERTGEKVSGAWVGLFENLESGASIDDFLEWFPGVKIEQVVAVLSHAEQSLTEA